MQPSDIYPLLAEARQAIGALFTPDYQQKFDEAGLEGADGFYLMVSLDFEPELASAVLFDRIQPYKALAAHQQGLESLVHKGFMEPAGAGQYRITEKGHILLRWQVDWMNTTFRAVEPLPAADLDRLVALLGRVVDRAEAGPLPADRTRITYNRHSDLGPAGAPVLRVLQYLADLGAFRDDCHIAAWRALGISPAAWEALSYVWRDEAHTADELAEKLGFRGHGAAGYAAALDEAARKGWLNARDGRYEITDSGRQVRDSAEKDTDSYFYGPWEVLSEVDLEALHGLLTRLRDRLRETSPAGA